MSLCERVCSAVILSVMEFCRDKTAMSLLRSCSQIYALRFNYHIKRLVLHNNLIHYTNFRVCQVYFCKGSNSELKKLPRTITYLILDLLNNSDPDYIIPDSVTTLVFLGPLNQPLQCNLLSENITNLRLGYKFSQPITPNLLPNSLRSLTLCWNFNEALVENGLPNNLESLMFGYSFNQPLLKNHLPPNLRHLTFGSAFNQPIAENVLSPCLTHLTFGYYFDQPLLKNVLPDSITCLSFGPYFKQSGFVVLPASICRLERNGKVTLFNKNFKNRHECKTLEIIDLRTTFNF